MLTRPSTNAVSGKTLPGVKEGLGFCLSDARIQFNCRNTAVAVFMVETRFPHEINIFGVILFWAFNYGFNREGVRSTNPLLGITKMS